MTYQRNVHNSNSNVAHKIYTKWAPPMEGRLRWNALCLYNGKPFSTKTGRKSTSCKNMNGNGKHVRKIKYKQKGEIYMFSLIYML